MNLPHIVSRHARRHASHRDDATGVAKKITIDDLARSAIFDKFQESTVCTL